MAGLPTQIEWSYGGTVSSNIVLEYTLGNPNLTTGWQVITNGVAIGSGGAGDFGWLVPATNAPACYIRVTDAADPLVNDLSDYSFALEDGLSLFSPNGGDSFISGATTTVAWGSSAITNATVELIFSPDGVDFDVAGTALLISGSAPNTVGTNNSFSWTIPGDVPYFSTNGRVRVQTADGLLLDDSDDPVTIAGLVVSEPTAGATVMTGSVSQISWYSAGAGATVAIEYSSDGGSSYAPLSLGVPCLHGSNSYDWTVGVVTSATARVRVTSVTMPAVTGASALFMVDGGMSVLSLDSDGDGMSDAWESSVGLSASSVIGAHGASGDPDGDGMDNYGEMVAGTDPLDSSSTMSIQSLVNSGLSAASSTLGVVRHLGWSSVSGRTYRVEAATSPAGPWTDVSGPLEATGSWYSFSHVDPSGSPSRFYRIVVTP